MIFDNLISIKSLLDEKKDIFLYKIYRKFIIHKVKKILDKYIISLDYIPVQFVSGFIQFVYNCNESGYNTPAKAFLFENKKTVIMHLDTKELSISVNNDIRMEVTYEIDEKMFVKPIYDYKIDNEGKSNYTKQIIAYMKTFMYRYCLDFIKGEYDDKSNE